MHPDIEKVLHSEQEIAARVKEMGAAITERYAGAKPGDIVVVGVLRGAAFFLTDLVRSIDLPIKMDFMAVSSYGSGVATSGRVRIIKDVDFDLKGKHVIIAEDVVDSGLTLAYLSDMFETKGAASVEIVALLFKDIEREREVKCADVGFHCGSEFLVGYGLDYAERYRNLPYVGILKPEIYE